jgi:hypothetical protein
MSTLAETGHETATDLEECIERAIKKLNVKNELDLRHYLPHQDGRLHHLTFAKLKNANPKELQMMIEMNILNKEPVLIQGKPRTKKTIKSGGEIKFNKSQLSRLIDILKKEGDIELISILSPHLSLSQIQKQLIESISAKTIDQELWDTYRRLVEKEHLNP